MDFDEYEYLEKMVENPESKKLEEAANGVDGLVKSADKDQRLSSRNRDEDDDLRPNSKRSRAVDDARGRDSHRDKRSSRHRSRSREVERSEKDVEKHNSSREHRGREKERDREERNGRYHGRERERDSVRERDRDSGRNERHREEESEKGKDKEERGSRSRSHIDRPQNDEVKSRDRERSERRRDREHREKSGDLGNMEKIRVPEHVEKSRDHAYIEKSHDRDPLDRAKKDETTEPEVDPERDQRTVFAYQLPLRADERDIFEFFSSAGKVRDVRLIMDRSSKRSKGVGYIEFYDVMSVPMAIALSGQLIRGVPVMVKPSEAEKNLVQSTATAAGGASLTGSGVARKLYVGNLVPNITEEQLRVVFETFGIIELVQLPRDETGLCKGFAFVQFSRVEDAKSAQTLNGQLDIGGRYIKVSLVTDQPGMQDVGATNGDLDDDEGGGLALNASSRALLMQKLDRSGISPSVGGSLASMGVNSAGFSASSVPMFGSAPIVDGLSIPQVALPNVATIGVPSECLLLTNMFDPKVETEPEFDLDIKDDVQDECAKFGALKHIFVDKFSDGHVYLNFDDTRAAMSAQQALHGRWFAGKMITATFMLPQNYADKFPGSG